MPNKKRAELLREKIKNRSFEVFQPDFRIYDVINTPLIVFDTVKQKPIFCNSAFEELSGYSNETVKEMKLTEFFPKEEQKRAQGFRDVLFNVTGEISEMDLKFRKRSGRKLSVNIFGKSIYSTKNTKIMVLAIHDISFIKKLQSEKESAVKEMNHVAKLADIGRLAAGVAHELNNPLMIIQGFAENIELMIENDAMDMEELKWQLNPILKATGRMAKIISQLTRLSRDDEQIALVAANVTEVLEDVIQLVKTQLNYNNIKLVKKYDKNLFIKCDPNQIEQIVLNIINNAIHAMMKIDVGRQLSVEINDKDGQVCLSIANNGPEIPVELKDKIMTPFFTTKEVGEGTGLGLSVSYGIMKAHGGDLNFVSEKGKGTQFNLIFPKLVGYELMEKPLPATGLVVDDEELAREIISTRLTKYGFQVLQASDGEEALQILKSNDNIDFIFTDARMPKMDGATLVKEIRSIDRNVLIFAITGFTGIRSIEKEMTKHGINGFLSKPLNHDKFTSCVKQIDSYVRNKRKAS